MATEYIFFYSSPVGVLELHATDEYLTRLYFRHEKGVSSVNLSEVMKKCIGQLDEYFAGVRTSFELPLKVQGTPFQEQVWAALQTIPYGETISYKQLAERAGNAKACRAVGTANGKNPLAVFIPCHRVIASDGSLGGYAGGLQIKSELLRLETCSKTFIL